MISQQLTDNTSEQPTNEEGLSYTVHLQDCKGSVFHCQPGSSWLTRLGLY